MKQIFLQIQNRLSELNDLKYIDKDWGQLQYDQPPVKFPCALIDVVNVDYTQQARGYQLAEADITITVANVNNIRSSAMAPNKNDSYAIIDLLEEIHDKLQLFTDGTTFQPLMRINLKKEISDKDAEIYTMTYKTGWQVKKTAATTTGVNAGLSVRTE